jgi:luciferase family oxidoreductase group 1
MRLSILDFQTPAGAIELVQRAEALGYHRYWLGEHHSAYQCANPLLLATVLAGLTQHIRLGSGGVCLRYCLPYRLAEDARLASYLFPARLDLGVTKGLRYEPAALQDALGGGGRLGAAFDSSYEEQVTALHQYLTGRLPGGHPLAAMPPYLEDGLPLWILGGSAASARLAARLGAGFCLSLHHDPDLERARAAVAEYGAAFAPSPEFPRPAVIAAVSGVCAAERAAARRLAGEIEAETNVPLGKSGDAGDSEGAAGAATKRPAAALASEVAGGRPYFVGEPGECADLLAALAERLGVEEVMVLDFITGHWQERSRMYELLAAACGLPGR